MSANPSSHSGVPNFPVGNTENSEKPDRTFGIRLNTAIDKISAQTLSSINFSGQTVVSLFPRISLRPQSEIPEDVRRRSKREEKLIDLAEPLVDENDKKTVHVRKCYAEICAVMGVEQDTFTVVVNDSNVANAYVSIIGRRIAISTELLAILEYKDDLIKAVLGHELGHVILQHYDDTETLFTNDFEEGADDALAFLKQKALSYDEEYQADRVSCLALALSGSSPASMIEVLKKIEIWKRSNIDDDGNPFADSTIPWLIQSHPVLQRRIRSMKLLVRSLPAIKKHDEDRVGTETAGDAVDSAEKVSLTPSHIIWPHKFIENIGSDKTRGLNVDLLAEREFEINGRVPADYESRSRYIYAISTMNPFASNALMEIVKELESEHGNAKLLANFFKKHPQKSPQKYIFTGVNEANIQYFPTLVSALKRCSFWRKSNEQRVIDKTIDEVELLPDEVNVLFSDTDKSHAVLEQWKSETSLTLNTDVDVSPLTFVRAWWGQNMNRAFDIDALEEISMDIAQYDQKTVHSLMHGYSTSEWPTFFLAKNTQSGLEAFYCPDQVPPIATLLAQQWLDSCRSEIPMIERIRLLFKELDDFWDNHGYIFPLGLDHVLFILDQIFQNGSDTDKEAVVALILENQQHLFLNQSAVSMFAMSQPLSDAVGLQIKGKYIYGKVSKIRPLENEIRQTSHRITILHRINEVRFSMIGSIEDAGIEYCTAMSATRVEVSFPKTYDEDTIRERLLLACQQFSLPESITSEVFSQEFMKEALPQIVDLYQHAITSASAAKMFLSEKILPDFKLLSGISRQIKKNAADEEVQDALRSVDITDQHIVLGSREFQRQFMTDEGREEFGKTRYVEIDRGAPLIADISRLWTLAYSVDFRAHIGQGHIEDALSLIATTFPLSCAARDQMLVETLPGSTLGILETMEDVTRVLELLTEVNNVPYLLRLGESLHNDFLKVSVSNRLYEVYQSGDADSFLSTVPDTVIQQFSDDTPASFASSSTTFAKTLLCLKVCFPTASFRRDELLTPLIDNAETWEEKQSIAHMNSDPAFGAVGRRSAKNVMVHESLFSAFQRLSSIDKAETLLYLLGEKNFLSGIENEFRGPSEADLINSFRWDSILHQETARDPDMDAFNDVKIRKVRGKTEISVQGYPVPEVSKPDGLIRLQKSAGIPIDLVFKQHNVAVSQREQLDAITEVLLGDAGILRTVNRVALLKRIARLMVEQGSLTNNESDKPAVESLIAVALCNCADEKLPSMFLDMWHLSAAEEKRPLPEIVAKMMQKAGPIFVVAAQYLAHQTHALPVEWVQAFRHCVDENKQFDSTLLDAHISANLGENPFADINEKIGEGSKAVVNKVTLPDGKKCAAKIFHGFIEAELPDDIRLLQSIVEHVNQNYDQFHVRLPANLSDVVHSKMVRQIDPASELEGLVNLRTALSESLLGVRFGTVDCLPAFTANSLLTYEYIDGVSLDKAEKLEKMGFDQTAQRVMRNATGLEVLRQMLKEGVYQSDPNLGNFLVGKNDGVVHWVDYGSVELLASEDRALLSKLLKTLYLRSTAMVGNLLAPNSKISTLFSEFISKETRNEAVSEKIASWALTHKDDFSMSNVEFLLKDLQDMCAKEGYVFSPQWVSVLGALSLLKPLLEDCPPESYAKVLGPLLK